MYCSVKEIDNKRDKRSTILNDLSKTQNIMTYSELKHAQTVLSDMFNLDTYTDIEQIRTDFEQAPETFECIKVFNKEDLEQLIKFIQC